MDRIPKENTAMMPHDRSEPAAEPSRRHFLKDMAVLPAAVLAAQYAAGAQPTPSQAKLPQIAFGKYSLSRLICGANPFNAGSHLSVFVNQRDAELLHARADPQDPAPLPGGGHQLLAVGHGQLRPLPPLPRRGRQDALPRHRRRAPTNIDELAAGRLHRRGPSRRGDRPAVQGGQARPDRTTS